MAKVKEISVSTSRKLGLPGYSSLDVSALISIELDEDEDVQEAYARAWKTVEDQVVGRIKKKGLESPVVAEAQNEDDPQDWLEHDTPEQQKNKIKANKRLQEAEEGLKKDKKKKTGGIPSIKPRKGGDK